MNVFTQNDLVYLLKQDQKQIDMIAAGMTAILFDTESKCETLKTQNWVRRMFASAVGAKSAKAEAIRVHAGALRAYCAEALAALYEHKKISDAMVYNLGEHIKSLFALHHELKNITGALAKNLDEEAKGADRFAALYKEIELGAFGSDDNAFWLYRMMAELDGHILADNRKTELLTNLIYEKGIFSKEPLSTEGFVSQMLSMPDAHVGTVYMELLNYQGNTTAELGMAAIERWHMQPRANKQYLKTETVAAGIMEEFGIEPYIIISPEIEFESMIEAKSIHIAAALEAAMLKTVNDLERERLLKERQQEIHANTQRNMQEFKSNAQELQVNVKRNVGKGMRSLKGFFGRTKNNIAGGIARRKQGQQNVPQLELQQGPQQGPQQGSQQGSQGS